MYGMPGFRLHYPVFNNTNILSFIDNIYKIKLIHTTCRNALLNRQFFY